MMNPSTPALEIKNLHKRYGKLTALNGLNLTVPQGAVMGLVGPNGAGKTTAFAIVAGLLRSNGGSIDLLGSGPFNPVRHKGVLTLLPQDAHLPGHSRVRETLIHFGMLQGLTSRASAASVDEILDWVDLKDRAKSAISTLSHGMIRRLAAAQAFIGDPKLVLLDEPTSGLDPQQVVRIRDLISSRRGRQTILISSHILSEIEAACDYVAFIDKGVTTRQDKLEDIVQKRLQVTIVLADALETLPDNLVRDCGDLFVSLSNDRKSLLIRFTDALSTSEVNRKILPVLLNSGIDIVEVRRGSDLEKVYLEDRLNHC